MSILIFKILCNIYFRYFGFVLFYETGFVKEKVKIQVNIFSSAVILYFKILIFYNLGKIRFSVSVRIFYNN